MKKIYWIMALACMMLVSCGGHEYVDLGLPSGLKWAACNVGASSPEEFGDYFAWGETSAKQSYTSDNCATYGVEMNDISGNAQYDVAKKKWGGKWRMPTLDEIQELIDNCVWQWITDGSEDYNGVNGCKVTSKINGNSIFLPAAGFCDDSSIDEVGEYGYYWSSIPYDYRGIGMEATANNLKFGYRYGMRIDFIWRSVGCSIRPVKE